jgi:thymidylate synthase ThyX
MTRDRDIAALHHAEKELSFGGTVLVLDDGAVVTAEDRAMIQALHSRNPKGVKEHLKILTEKGSGKMMSSFYVGYGHKSIGDCGFVSIFVEGVSMLAAKAIQHSPLYNGQECSTRYIDFTNQPFFNPVTQNYDSHPVTEKFRGFYLTSLPVIVEHLQSVYPKHPDEDEKIYLKAINARAFDILRGFLPTGATTNVAWTTTLRHVADHLMYLRHHPLAEVREIAEKVQDALLEMYPSSFGHKRYDDTERFNRAFMQGARGYYFEPKEKWPENVKFAHNGVSKKLLAGYLPLLKSRKARTEVPKAVGVAGNAVVSFLLDFGSWRDLQRHRSVVQLMPRLTTKFGFEPWYLDNLPKDVRAQAQELLAVFEKGIKKIKPDERQYLIPMGYKVPVLLSGDLSALTYIAEIRSASTVHATLQKKAVQLAELLSKTFGYKVFFDKKDVGRFDSKRGKHDIVEKK